MGNSHRNELGITARILRANVPKQLATLGGLALTALLALSSLAGCTGSTESASPQPSEVSTVRPSPTAGPTPSPTPTPTFVVTGSMHDRRMNATATLLANGKVLIAGGRSDRYVMSAAVLASAELYDPATGKFTPTGSMTAARADHTATLLPDGRVLIAGGYGCLNPKRCIPEDLVHANGGPLATAELYDPATGKFTNTGSMTTPRELATATLLLDGRVLLASGSVETQAAELYEPATGAFTRRGLTLFSYTIPTALLLPNGKVLLVGPEYAGTVAEEYDPASGQSTPVSLAVPLALVPPESLRTPATATLLQDGSALLGLCGGYLWTYEPTTGTFKAAGSISTPAAPWNSPTTTALPDGRVLFAGGITYAEDPYNGGATASAGVYDTANGFGLIDSMATARFDHTTTLLPDGSVLIAGGTANGLSALSSAEILRL